MAAIVVAEHALQAACCFDSVQNQEQNQPSQPKLMSLHPTSQIPQLPVKMRARKM